MVILCICRNINGVLELVLSGSSIALAIWEHEAVPVSGTGKIEKALPYLFVIHGLLSLLICMYVMDFKIYL